MKGLKWGKVDVSLKPKKIVIVATGPSLIDFDYNLLRDRGYYIICVNEAWKNVPFADAWFTLDPHGFSKNQLPKSPFTGQLFAAVPEDFGLANARIGDHRCYAPPEVTYLHRIVWHSLNGINLNEYLNWGLNEDVGSINTLNSGYGAFGLAYHYRPEKILLLGLDASSGYAYNPAQVTRSLQHLPALFQSTLPQINAAKIEVINGSENSKIECFPRMNVNKSLVNF